MRQSLRLGEKPCKIYADPETLEDKALQQFRSAMELDSVLAGALMADAHTGYSLPIGAVVATDRIVFPSWVGYDIGCGMCAMKMPISADALIKNREKIFREIYEAIPTGFSVNKEVNLSENLFIPHPTDLTSEAQAIAEQRQWMNAIGSLGGGNHFIEIGLDQDNAVWAIIHSGSRGVGHGIATHWMKVASGDGKAREGHFGLRTDSLAGQDYVNDLNWCLRFALENRREMLDRIITVIGKVCGELDGPSWSEMNSSFINRNHNHAELSNGMWIHRKGATHAEKGMMGVIPGNMRDGCFIVKGKGCRDSLWSSSHGAGRCMSRTKAKNEISMTQFSDAMHGITARVSEKTKDEAPFAYKDLFDVMSRQSDLVEIVTHVRPIINVKG